MYDLITITVSSDNHNKIHCSTTAESSLRLDSLQISLPWIKFYSCFQFHKMWIPSRLPCWILWGKFINPIQRLYLNLLNIIKCFSFSCQTYSNLFTKKQHLFLSIVCRLLGHFIWERVWVSSTTRINNFNWLFANLVNIIKFNQSDILVMH